MMGTGNPYSYRKGEEAMPLDPRIRAFNEREPVSQADQALDAAVHTLRTAFAS
jgi:hypothetical protein